jgi:superfamily II DNA/RNA helicase
MEKKKITAHTIKTIIIDEADRSMDSRDYNGIKALVKATQKDRQMILVSATITEDIHIKSKELLQSPQLILLDTQPVVAATVEHWYFVGDQRDKLDTIRRIVRAKKIPAALVFVNHSDDIDLIVHKLNNIGLKAAGLYSSMDKVQRKNAMTHLHAKKIELLVATDLAARGLDFPDMPVVFHLDLPLDPQVYLHRSGRTGRAGKSGISIAVLNRRELEWILEYPTKLNIFPVEKIISRAEIQDAKKA